MDQGRYQEAKIAKCLILPRSSKGRKRGKVTSGTLRGYKSNPTAVKQLAPVTVVTVRKDFLREHLTSAVPVLLS